MVTDRSTFDRRKYPRVRTSRSCRSRAWTRARSLAHALDVSIGGIRFQCVGLEVDLGETLRVQLTIGDRTIQVVGKLVRVTDLDGFTQEVALSFTEVDAETLRFLTQSLPEGYEPSPTRSSAPGAAAWPAPRGSRAASPPAPCGPPRTARGPLWNSNERMPRTSGASTTSTGSRARRCRAISCRARSSTR